MSGSAGDVLGAAGQPLFVTWNEIKFPLAYPTLKVEDRVEKMVVRQSIDALEELRDTLSPAEYSERKTETNDLIRTRQHKTGGRMWAQEMAANGGKRGVQYILWAYLAEGRAGAPAEERAKIPEVAFNDVPKLIAESHDADAMIALIAADFMTAVGPKLELTAEQMKAMLQQFTRDLNPT